MPLPFERYDPETTQFRPGDPPKEAHLKPKVRCERVSVASQVQCKQWAVRGSDPPRCVRHSNAKEKARAMVAHEVRQWTLGDTKVDPGEMLLRLVSQAAARLDRYSSELAELVDEEGLRAALIGEVRVPTEAGSYVSGDYVRGLARLESEERDRLANFSKLAVAANLGQRQIELAEAQGRVMARIIAKVFEDPLLELTEEQLQRVPRLLRRAQNMIEHETVPAQIEAG